MFLSWWLSIVGCAQSKTGNGRQVKRRRMPRKFRSALTVEHLEDRVVPTSGTAHIFLNLQNAPAQLNTVTAARGSIVPVFIDFAAITAGSIGGLGGGAFFVLYDPTVLSISETPTSVGSDIKLGSLVSSLSTFYSLSTASGFDVGVVAVGLVHSGTNFLTGTPTGHLIELDFHVVASTAPIGSSTLLDLQTVYTDVTGNQRLTLQTDKFGVKYNSSPPPTAYASTSVPPPSGVESLSGLTQPAATAPATFSPSDADTDDASIQIVARTPLAPAAAPDTYSMAPNTDNFTPTMSVTGQAHGVLANDSPTANGPMTALLTLPGATATTVPALTILNNITGASESGRTVTITTGSAYNLLPGETLTITGVATPGYNGTYQIVSVPDNQHFTYNTTTLDLAPDLGSGNATVMTPATTLYAGNIAHGTIVLNALDGSFIYTPVVDFVGTDTFTYKAVDAASNTASANATVTLYVGGVLNMPQNINKDAANQPIVLGSRVVVPVNVLNPNPINSGGLGNITVGINYDANVFDPNNITINAGPLVVAAGWTSFTTNVTNPGQIVIATSATGGSQPIVSTTGGAVALITFNVIGLPTGANKTSVINLSQQVPQISQLDVNGIGIPTSLPLAIAPVDNTNFNGPPGPDDGSVTFGGQQPLNYSAAANPGVTSYALHVNAGNGNLELVDIHNPTAVLATLPAAQANGVTITGHPGGNDTLTLDYSSGYFSVPTGINFNGGGAGTLNILGGAFVSVTDNASGPGAGNLSLHPSAGGDTSVTYAGLAPITVTSTATDVTINLPAGTQDAILKDSGTIGMETISATGNSFESFTFADPTGTLFVNGTSSAAEKLNVQSLNASFDANLNINLQGGADEIDFTGPQTVAGSKALTAAAQTIGLCASLNVATIVGTAATVNVSNAASLQVGAALVTSGGIVNVAPGSYAGDVNVNQNVTLAPGGPTTTGMVTQTGNLAFTNGSSTSFQFVINGPTPGTQYDQYTSSGTVSLNGANLSLSGSYAPVAGTVFTLVSAASVTGTFHGFLDLATVPFNGQNWTIHYGATNVTLTVDTPSLIGQANVFLNLQNATAQLNTVTAARGSTVPVFIDFDTIAPSSNGGLGGGTFFVLYDPMVLSISETSTALGSDIKVGSLLSSLPNYSLTTAAGFDVGVVAVGLVHSGATFLTGAPTGHLIELDFHVIAATAPIGSSTLLDLQSTYTGVLGNVRLLNVADEVGVKYNLSPPPTEYASISDPQAFGLQPISALTQPGATTPATFSPSDADPDDASIQIVTQLPNLAPTVLPDTYSMAPNLPAFSTTMTVTGQPSGVLGNDTKTANGPMTALLTSAGATSTSLPASINTIASASETGMVVTITTAAASTLVRGQAVTIAGLSVAGYNGAYDVATVVDSTHFTYNIDPTNPAKLNLPFDAGSVTSTATATATTIYSAPTNAGTVWLNAADGTFAYTPLPGFTGTDSFTYKAVDAASNTASANATVTIYVGGVLNIPQGINRDTTSAPITIGSHVVVPVNVFNPNPINSGGLGNVTIGINYDPTIFDPLAITVTQGAVNNAAGWNQITTKSNTPGQIVITTSLTGAGSAITATTAGSLALITFNVIGIPSNGNHTSVINLSEANPQTSDLDVIGAGNFAALPQVFALQDNTNFNGPPGVDDGSVQFVSVVNGNNTSISLGATVNGGPVAAVTYGTPVTLTAIVTDTSASAPPTVGSVDFKDGAIDLGVARTPGTQTANTTTFVLTLTPNQLQVLQASGGVHTITAFYTDGTSFLGSSTTLAGGLTVRPAPLTITSKTNTKVYDGTTSAATLPTVSGLIGKDQIFGLAEAYSDKNAGSSKTLSVSAYTINDGNYGNDYAVTMVNNTTGVVTKATLTIAATPNEKTYDSTITAAALPTVTGLQGTDTVTGLSEVYGAPPVPPAGGAGNANVGVAKTLTVSSYTVNDSNGGNNYTTTTSSTSTGVIDQAALTITATTNAKTYDSTTTAAATPTVAGLFGTDSVTGLAEVYGDKNAGSSKTLSVTTFAVHDGNGGNNYTVATVNITTGTITKAALTITAATNTKTYDGTITAAALPLTTGLVGSDTVTGLAEVYDNSKTGTGKTLSVVTAPRAVFGAATPGAIFSQLGYVVNDGNGGNNYTVNTVSDTTGVINKAALTITALTSTKTYDATTTAAAAPIVAGVISGDSVTGLSEAYTDKNAGPGKTLNVSDGYTVNDGNNGNNYSVTTVANTTGLINKAALLITAVTNTKFFDGTSSAAATPAVAGLQGSDLVLGLAEFYTDANIGTGIMLSVGTFTVNDGYGGSNYIVTTANELTGAILPPGTDVSILSRQESALTPPKGSTAPYLFTIHLAQALTQAVTANYSTFNGTGVTGAKAGTDFKGVSNVTVTIPAGVTDVPVSITLQGAPPQMPGGPTDKFFTVQLAWAVSSASKQQNIVTVSATADIRQVFAPTISIASSQIVHLANGTYGVGINVLGGYPSLAYAQADGPASVGYSTANGTAKSGTNYKGTSGVLAIPASALVSGSSTVTVPITAIGAAAGQYFNVNLVNAGNAALVPGSTTGQVFIYNPQVAAGRPTGASGGVVLTSISQLTSVIKAAEANWEALGVNASIFKNVQFQIGNIGNGVLANTAGNVITIDAGAAGFGWYTNPGAIPDAYFATVGAAAGHMDLLTVIEHELGHILSLDDVDGGNTIMATTLAAGVRRLP